MTTEAHHSPKLDFSPSNDSNIALPIWMKNLPGGSVIWVVVLAELITFFLFFIAYAVSYRAESEIYIASQAMLSRTSGAINTAILLTGSWMAARAAWAHQQKSSSRGWWLGTAILGLFFTCIKTSEYIHVFREGITLSTNSFWFFYLFLTLMHLVHVMAGIGFSIGLALRSNTEKPPTSEATEATATYWHMVDLIWIILFPLLYLVKMR